MSPIVLIVASLRRRALLVVHLLLWLSVLSRRRVLALRWPVAGALLVGIGRAVVVVAAGRALLVWLHAALVVWAGILVDRRRRLGVLRRCALLLKSVKLLSRDSRP